MLKQTGPLALSEAAPLLQNQRTTSGKPHASEKPT